MTARGVWVGGVVAGLVLGAAGAAEARQWRTALKAEQGAVGVDLEYMDRSNPNEPTATIVMVLKQNQGADYITQRVRVRCAEGQWMSHGGAAFTLDGERVAAIPVDEANNPWMPVAGTAGDGFHQAICQDVWAEPAVNAPLVDYARALRFALTQPAG